MNESVRWQWRVLGKKKIHLLFLTLIQAITGSIGVAYALLLRSVVDGAVAGDRVVFWRSMILMAAAVSLHLILAAVYRWLLELTRASFENVLKERLFGTILRKDFSAVSATHTAEWLNRLTNDVRIVAEGSSDLVPGAVGTIIRLTSALTMMIVLEPGFAFILIPGGLLMILITLILRKGMKKLHKNVQESDGRLRIFLQERIGHLMLVKAFSAERSAAEGAKDRMDAHKAARMKRNRFSNFCHTGFGIAMQGMYLIGIFYCAYGILTGTVSYGTLTAVIQLIGQIQSPLANISGYLPRYYTMCASAERLMESEAFADDSGSMEPEALREFYQNRFTALKLENVTFAYPPEKAVNVLNQFSMELRKGEMLGFSGASGSGKSTVMKLLLCLYPVESGASLINEEPLTAGYRRLFAYVPQGNALMNGTIREVVSFARPEQAGEDEQLWEALRIACADEFVMSLDMMLGEEGSGLSEGQMQRIAVARAIFSQAPILLLDESTSALDEKTEHALLSNIKKLTDKTVILITHRKAALDFCDRVIEFHSS